MGQLGFCCPPPYGFLKAYIFGKLRPCRYWISVPSLKNVVTQGLLWRHNGLDRGIFVCHFISVETNQDLHLGVFEGADFIFYGPKTVSHGLMGSNRQLWRHNGEKKSFDFAVADMHSSGFWGREFITLYTKAVFSCFRRKMFGYDVTKHKTTS